MHLLSSITALPLAIEIASAGQTLMQALHPVHLSLSTWNTVFPSFQLLIL
jgi:hypothetical protein